VRKSFHSHATDEGYPRGSRASPPRYIRLVIALAHIRRLELVKTLYCSVLIPPAVKTECIDRGRAIGAQDVYEIEQRLQQGWITVIPLGKNSEREATQLMARARIGQGEAEAIMPAKESGVPVILDDAEILTSLSRVLWVSPDVIAEILRRAEG